MSKIKNFSDLNHETQRFILAIDNNFAMSGFANAIWKLVKKNKTNFAIFMSNGTILKDIEQKRKKTVYHLYDISNEKILETFDYDEILSFSWNDIIYQLFLVE